MFKQLFPATAALLAAAPLAHAAVTATVDFGTPTGVTATPRLYGINTYAYTSDAQADPIYRANITAMRPGLVRWHYGFMMKDAASDPHALVTNPGSTNYAWDETRIAQYLSDATGSGGAYSHGEDKMIDLVNWPAFMDDGKGHLRADQYDAYAAFCAEAVRIINVRHGYGFKYFEVFNELENGVGTPYDGNMGELAKIFNKCAAAMKAVDPSIKVGGPAFARPDLGYNVDAWIQGTSTTCDFLTYHGYPTGDRSATNQTVWDGAALGWETDLVKSSRAKNTTRPMELFQGEYNISWNPPDDKMTDYRSLIFDALAMIDLTAHGADGAMAWNDADGWYGKLTGGDGGYARRPASYVFQYFSEDLVGKVVTSSSSSSGAVTVEATRNAAIGKDSIALVNRSEADQTVPITLKGLSGAVTAQTRVTVKRASQSGGSVTASTVGALTGGLTLPANTVTVVSFTDSGAVTPTSINAGGPAAGAFAADAGYSGGYTYSVSDTVATAGVTGAAPAAVYQSERYGAFTYTLTGLTPGGAYTLKLHFAEIYWNAAGQRVFDVTANGAKALSGFDIVKAAGGKDKAVVQTVAVTADSLGRVAISFAPTSGSPDQNAKVSGIEIAATASPKNLLPNGGFESAGAGWGSVSAAVVTTAADVHSGTSALKITGSGAGCYRTVTGLTPNTTYALSGFLKADGVGGDDAYLFVQNANGTYSQTAPVTATAYTAASLTFTTAAGQTSASLGVWKDAGTGSAWADDLTLTAK